MPEVLDTHDQSLEVLSGGGGGDRSCNVCENNLLPSRCDLDSWRRHPASHQVIPFAYTNPKPTKTGKSVLEPLRSEDDIMQKSKRLTVAATTWKQD